MGPFSIAFSARMEKHMKKRNKDYLSRWDAARIAGKHVNTIDNWSRAGKFVEIVRDADGQFLGYREDDVRKFLAERVAK